MDPQALTAVIFRAWAVLMEKSKVYNAIPLGLSGDQARMITRVLSLAKCVLYNNERRRIYNDGNSPAWILLYTKRFEDEPNNNNVIISDTDNEDKEAGIYSNGSKSNAKGVIDHGFSMDIIINDSPQYHKVGYGHGTTLEEDAGNNQGPAADLVGMQNARDNTLCGRGPPYICSNAENNALIDMICRNIRITAVDKIEERCLNQNAAAFTDNTYLLGSS